MQQNRWESSTADLCILRYNHEMQTPKPSSICLSSLPSTAAVMTLYLPSVRTVVGNPYRWTRYTFKAAYKKLLPLFCRSLERSNPFFKGSKLASIFSYLTESLFCFLQAFLVFKGYSCAIHQDPETKISV